MYEVNIADFRNFDGIRKYCGPGGDIVISNKFKEIPAWSFCGNNSLRSVTFTRGVVKILESGFSDCTNLEELILPEGLEKIMEGAFNRCTKLKALSVPGSVKTVYDEAFSVCESLEILDINNGVIELKPYAFSGCVNLQRVIIPSSVQVIGEGAFKSCTSLEEIVILGETKVCDDAFADCDNVDYFQSYLSIDESDAKNIFGSVKLAGIKFESRGRLA